MTRIVRLVLLIDSVVDHSVVSNDSGISLAANVKVQRQDDWLLT